MIDIPASQRDDRPGDGRHGADLVGREAELDRIRSFLASARRSGGALLVTGEAGVGKTELLNAASAIASAADTRVLHAAGVEFEAEMSYAGLNQVLLPLLGTLPGLPAVHRDALNVALGFGDGPPPSRLVVSNAALVLLRESAAPEPLLVIIDDLPWLDRASASVLSFVARRLQGTGIGFLGASRTAEENFFERSGLPQLEVQRLDDAASVQLLDKRFSDLDSTVRERILVEAQGNPLALLELPVALGPSLRASAKALPPTLPLGSRLQALYRSRIAGLPPRTRGLLLLTALDGTGDVRVLEAGGVEKATARDLAPAELERVAYVDEATHRLAFYHPLMRSAVVELAEAHERRAAHRMLADVWESQPDRRAWHLAEATVEPDEFVAAELEAAAARILARGDAVGCVKALTRASDVTPGGAERRRRLAAAAYIGADVAGDLSNASQVLAELRRGDTEVEGSLQAAVTASVFLLQGDGDVATAHRLLVGAIEGRAGTLDGRDPVLAEALQSLMMVCSFSGMDDLWQPFEVAIARVTSLPLAVSLNARILADPVRAGPDALEALDLAIADLHNESDPSQVIRIGMAASYVDRVDGCRDALWRVIDDARAGGAVAAGIFAMIQLGEADFRSGDWDEAEQLAEEAVRACEAHGYRSLIWPSRFIQAAVAAGRGDAARAALLLEEILQWTKPRGIHQFFDWHVRALAALGRGDFEVAYGQASMICPAGVLLPHRPHELLVILDLVESAVRTGRHTEAAAHVDAMREANLARLSPRLAFVVAASAAMAAPDDSAFALFENALALPGVERWHFDLARVRLDYGERLRRKRSMVEARVQLNAALATFERLGARPWVDRATAELRATGQTKPRGGDNVFDRLTAQEFEIVSLAASGLTNKQIGERLFLSHRTVGGHLHRAFPKLGVATRAALRDALESLRPEQRPLN